MATNTETVIIGGGQAGLSVSYFLSGRGREHTVLEKADRPGNAWRNDRWDSFTLVTPNWSFLLPGGEYQGDQPNGYMPREEIVRRFEAYVEQNRLPVEFGVQVDAVEPDERGYLVRTSRGSLHAKNVVIASGLFQKPKIPPFAARLPADILQLHSGRYRNPEVLPPGAVLVVGAGQSGCQIAEELREAGREVYLSTGRAGRAPRDYLGKDIYVWANLCGLLNRTPAQLRSPQDRFGANPQLSGKNGGHTLNLHQFARDGIHLLGRMQDVRDGKAYFAADLAENLAWSDQFEKNIVQMVDRYLDGLGMGLATETLPELKDGYDAPSPRELELSAAKITTIIWALGYAFDFNMVKLPVCDESGFPLSNRGETEFAGLYFAGMPWLPGQKSGLLLGVADQAEYVATQILAA